MLRLVTRLAFLASVIYSATAYTGCNQIQFCQNYRQQSLDQNQAYWADIGSISTNNNVAKIQLKNNQNEQLTLEISFLENNKARMKIGSDNHKRFELAEVLVEEPKTVGLEVKDKNDNSVTLSPSNAQSIKLIVRKGSPFSIESYYNNEIESIFDGSRFNMKNTDNDESFHFNVIFPNSKVLYGLHHHATKLVLMETGDGSHEPYRLRNSDTFGYQVGNTEALYGAVPVVWGHSPSRTSGVFLQNAAQQWVDITYKNQRGPSAHFMVESAAFDLFIMFGPTPKETLKQYTDLTGKAHMPQLWSLGYHQCRYSYETQEEVTTIISKMDENNFAMDAIWLDIDYSDGKKYFTWNPNNFRDPEGMQRTIGSTNRKLVTIIDPHIKVQDGYSVYDGAKGKYFVKDSSGNNDFQADCWPGRSSWIDFLNPEARAYWVSQYSYNNFKGQTPVLAGTWNDMNEPALFNAGGSENSLPGDCRHYGNVKHRDIHNAYGFLNSIASHEAMLKRDDGKLRPFVLSRSHFAGSQRYAAMWTGDSNSNVEYLAIGYSECLLSGIMGHVFCGSDIGGFAGNPNDNLLQRWYQAAMWLPFFRNHANSNTNHREPYLFNDDVRKVIRNAIQTRYRHLQVFYTLFYLHSKTGEPVIRPLFYEYPEMMDQDDHLLLGTDILATPILKEYTEDVQAHFPGNSSTLWYRADNGQWNVFRGGSQQQLHADINASPYFYRGGSIVATKDNVKRSSTDMKDDPFTVYVNYDTNGKAEGVVYNDDHASFDYQSGQFYLIKLVGNGNQVQMNKIDGNMNVDFKIDKVVTHRLSVEDPTKVVETVHTTTADGTPLIDLDFNLLKSNGHNSSYTFYL